MEAYNNNPTLKTQLVAMARQHEAEDRYIRGDFYRNGTPAWKGCSQGCTVKSLQLLGVIDNSISYSDHLGLGNALGVPVFLTRIADRLFESLPNGEHIPWTGDLYEAIQVGKDLSAMQHDFLNWMLNHPRWGTAQYTSNSWALRVAEMYVSSSTYTQEQWKEARGGATSAAAAATAAAEAYAVATAEATAYAAEAEAAATAAAAYAEAAAAYAAESAAAYAAAYADVRGQYWQDVRAWVLSYVATPELVAA